MLVARAMRHSILFALSALAPVLVACGGAVSESSSDKARQSSTSEGSEPPAKAEAEPEDECAAGDRQSCGTASTQACEKDDTGRLVWGACKESGGSSTPLVLVFDGAPVTFADAPGTTFDVAGDGASHVTSWPTARTPWLALDRDGNGRIDDGSELFGSMTRLATGVRAKNGFEALAELDSNHDGAITADDEAFAKLVVWSDANADRTASAAEQTAASERILRIELAYRRDARCTTSGDCEIERAKLVYRAPDGTERVGEIVDVHLRHRSLHR